MSVFETIPGGSEVIRWFGREPEFHDGYIRQIDFFTGGKGTLVIHGWNMTDRVDDKGYFILEKHALVKLNLSGVNLIELRDFNHGSIIFELWIIKNDDFFEIKWSSSCGTEGRICVREITMELSPGEPAST